MRHLRYAIVILSVTTVLGQAQTVCSEEAKSTIELKAGSPKLIRAVPIKPRVVKPKPVRVVPVVHPRPVRVRQKAGKAHRLSEPRLVGHKEYINLEEALRNSNDVVQLNLSRQVFEYFPEEVFTLSNLEVLRLSNMQLSDIPSEIASLSKLRVLVLSYNQLEYLPYGIGDLSLLRTLDLANNRLEAIPDEIGNLRELQVLNLSKNNISTLPEGIKDLKDLKRLHLDGNPLPNWEIVEIADELPDCKIVF